MPEHHHGTAGPDILPLWVQIAWIAVLAAIAASHAVHVLTMRGQARGWHSAHLLMGVGMLYMVTPWVGSPGSTRAWQYLFAAAALAVAGWVAHEWQAGRAVSLLWLPAGLGLVAMAYMFHLHRGLGGREVTYALVAYHLAEAAAWSHGWLAGSGLDCGSRDVAVSQVAMALAMGYMFLAMDADAAAFLAKAFTTGAVTEQSVWAVSLIALVVLACVPPPLSPRCANAAPRARRGTPGVPRACRSRP